MSIRNKLKKMNKSDLIFICHEIGIKCSKNNTKITLINKLLSPLKRTYKMDKPLLSVVGKKNMKNYLYKKLQK